MFHFCYYFSEVKSVSWEDWWTYDGISGPSFWGLINPEWSLCNEGRKQSPVDIEAKKLLYDPTLEKISLGQDKAHGLVLNTGHGVSFFLGAYINDVLGETQSHTAQCCRMVNLGH